MWRWKWRDLGVPRFCAVNVVFYTLWLVASETQEDSAEQFSGSFVLCASIASPAPRDGVLWPLMSMMEVPMQPFDISIADAFSVSRELYPDLNIPAATVSAIRLEVSRRVVLAFTSPSPVLHLTLPSCAGLFHYEYNTDRSCRAGQSVGGFRNRTSTCTWIPPAAYSYTYPSTRYMFPGRPPMEFWLLLKHHVPDVKKSPMWTKRSRALLSKRTFCPEFLIFSYIFFRAIFNISRLFFFFQILYWNA